jgi:hypothetical protein
MTNPGLDDETLMAYADGELGGEEARAVEQAVANDEALAARVAMFKETRELARLAYEPDLNETLPEALLAGVNVQVAGARSGRGKVLELRKRPNPPEQPLLRRNMAMAASFAALAGVVVGYLVALGTASIEPQDLSLGSSVPLPLAEILSSALSGEERFVADMSGRVRLIATFRDPDGTLCREFGYTRADAAPLIAVSCRETGKWRLTFAVSASREDGAYVTASSEATVDAYLESIHAGPPLAESEERSVLSD